MSCAVYYANLALLIIFCILAVLQILKVHEGFSSGNVPIFLYMEGCPHCHNMMPAWKRFGRGRMVEYKTAEGQKYLNIARSAGIYKGFPCVFAVNGDKVVSVYEGDRSYESLMAWYSR